MTACSLCLGQSSVSCVDHRTADLFGKGNEVSYG